MSVKRRAASFLILGALIVASLVFLPASGASDEPVKVQLSIDFDEKGSGNFHLYIGSGAEQKLDPVDRIPSSISPYKNENMERVLRSLRLGLTDEISLIHSILYNPGNLTFDGLQFYQKVDRTYFGLSIDVNFTFETRGMDAEFEYLEFLFDIEKFFDDPSGGLGTITGAVARERELGRIGITLVVELEKGLTITSSSSVSDHERTISGESLIDHTTAQSFLRSSNMIKVFDCPAITPPVTFTIMIIFLLIGYGFMAIIWNRERFSRVGLILPIATLVISLTLPWSFFSPGLSFYDLGGATIWILGSLFLVFVAASNHFHPKVKVRSFEEEKEDQPSVEMPEVIYVQKRVFVERKVKVDDVEGSDPYEVLELDEKATFEEIDRSYKSKVKEYHPDKFTKSPKHIASAAKRETEKLNIAYEKLKKKHRR